MSAAFLSTPGSVSSHGNEPLHNKNMGSEPVSEPALGVSEKHLKNSEGWFGSCTSELHTYGVLRAPHIAYL